MKKTKIKGMTLVQLHLTHTGHNHLPFRPQLSDSPLVVQSSIGVVVPSYHQTGLCAPHVHLS